MKNNGRYTLISMTDFLLWIRGMTTTELCKEIPNRFKSPVWSGNKNETVQDFFLLDSQKWKLVGEYAKFLKQPLTISMFVPLNDNGEVSRDNGELKHFIRVIFDEWFLNQPNEILANLTPNVNCISKGKYQITFFKSGEVYLDNIESMETAIIKNVEELGLRTGFSDLFLTSVAINQIGL